jgi:CRP-like cAMP-binding protein
LRIFAGLLFKGWKSDAPLTLDEVRTLHMIDQSSIRNRLLSSLAPEDFALLAPAMKQMDLKRDYVLVWPNQPINHVYFIESGMVSVVAQRADGRSIEVGVYGRDGMGPTNVMLASDRTPHDHYMQIGGTGFRMQTARFLEAVDQSAALRTIMLRFVHVFMTQTAQSALVNGSSIIEERLARWVLMCQDRLDAMEFPITHDFLSMMLGVRRSSVTDAIHLLEAEMLIKATRGNIKILDRDRLLRAAGTSYGVPEAEYARLIGPL